MDTIKKRILEIAKHYSLSMRSFEERCGLLRGNLSNMAAEGAIGSDKLSKIIVNCLDINPMWLLSGEGEMLKSEAQPTAITSTTVKEDNNLLNHLQKENKELKAEINSLNKQIGKLEGKLEDACELIESLKKEIPVPGFLRAVK